MDINLNTLKETEGLFILACQNGDWLRTSYRVGYFPVDETLPPYQPQKSKLVAVDLQREPTTWYAWVVHDGKGGVEGFPINRDWEEFAETPEDFIGEGGEKYNPPEHVESYVMI